MAKAVNKQETPMVDANDSGVKVDELAGIGGIAPARKTAKVDPFEQVPSFVPGKNFEKGKTLAGLYVTTKRVVSEKITAGKRDAQGRMYRDLHTFRDVNSGKKFGIWSTGQLGAVIPFLSVNQYVEIEYLGLGTKAIRAGQSPSHEFDIRSEGDVNIDFNHTPAHDEDVG